MLKKVVRKIHKGISGAFYFLIEPSSRRIVKHILKDRNLQEQLRARFESMDLEAAEFTGARRCGNRLEILGLAIEAAQRAGDGLWLEFGVWKGKSLNYIAQRTETTVYGFDSFEGLPERWHTGSYSRAPLGKRDLHDKLPEVADNARLVKGWFKETLPEFFQKHPEPAVLVHIDSDLYSSAKCVLDHLKYKNGTVVLFDEYYNYPAWREGEYKAFKEFLGEKDVSAECLGFCPVSGQTAFVLKVS